MSGYIKSLDGLRAIAVLLVMTFHFEMNMFGWIGVQLFFVLSGFLITGILWKEKFRELPMPYRFKKFWIRRSLRIFPLYFGYLFIISLFYVIFHSPSYYRLYIPYLLTYTANYSRLLPLWQVTPLFNHLWSLSVEEQFYLLFPFFIFLCPPRMIRSIVWFVVIAGPLVRYGLEGYYILRTHTMHDAGDALYWNTLSQLDAFCIGGMIPVLSLDKRIKRPQVLLLLLLPVVVLAGALNFLSISPVHSFSAYFTTLGYEHAEIRNYQAIWSYSLLNFFFASVILVLASDRPRTVPGPLRRLLESKWMVRIGKVSYGMYIFHFPVMAYVFHRHFSQHRPLARIGYFLVYLLIVYGISWASFRFYESWFLKWKDRIYAPGSNLAKDGIAGVGL